MHAITVPATTLWTSPDAPRDVDAPITKASPDPAEWARSLDVPARRDLHDRVHTQLLLGEPVEVIGESGDWLEVIAPWQPSKLDPRGYPGWLPRDHVAAWEPPEVAADAVVAVTTTPVDGDGVVSYATYGTILPVAEETSDRVRVLLPDGGSGWLARSACVVRRRRGRGSAQESGETRPEPTGRQVLDVARRFVGLDYLWGGMSAFGLDCSGLVHLSFRTVGVTVPRDADDQAAAADSVPVDEAQAGDLYFFRRSDRPVHHVGFATGTAGHLLHSPRTGRQIVEEPLDAERQATLMSKAGRFVSPSELSAPHHTGQGGDEQRADDEAE
ncbi:MAG TPA: NlpC/P60 family protein [Actinopolymorphaceae bacterium]|jgi:hypothetical protein